jgi:Guanine nucleotide exchange factor synembryn
VTEIFVESETNLEVSTGLAPRTGIEMPPTAFSGDALDADSGAAFSGTGQSGRVRKNWGVLFTETCKLLYALYSGDKYEYGGMEEFLAGQRIFLVYDILSEVIVAPHSFEDSSAAAGYEDSITQSSCRRHSLQLAMLSLDLDAMTQQSSTAPAISSSVPLMLKILIANGGVKALCCLLEEYFSQLPLRSTSIPSSSPVALLSPILVILIRIATSSSSGRAELKASIFPNPWKSDSEDDLEEAEEAKADYLQQKMDPTDIPSGTLRAHLVNMMTSLDDVLKRYCAELLYELCDKETGEFVSRTGFGNAIALMQIKGLI